MHGFLGETYKSFPTSRQSGEIAMERLAGWDRVLGVLTEEDPKRAFEMSPQEVERYIKLREEARARKDFREADRIRAFLSSKGVLIKDTPSGPRWQFGS